MKIAFLLPSNSIAGGILVTYTQGHALKRKGHDVTIIYSLFNADQQFVNYPEFSLNYTTTDSAVLSNEEYDVVIATWWETFYEMFKIRAQHHFYFVQSDERRFYLPEQLIQKLLVQVSYSFKDIGVITEAMWIKRMLEKEFGASVEYAPNGVDTKIFNPEVTPLSPRTDKFRVLIEGASSLPYKRVDDAFAAANQISDIEIWYVSSDGSVGPNRHFDRLFKSVNHIDMPAIYRSCDVLLKLSAVEGFFGPPLEMMACGNVSIVSNVTGHEEFIKDGHNALVVPVGDIQAAAAAIRRLINEPNLRKRLSFNALETAHNLDWRKQTPHFERALLKLARSLPSISEKDKELILSLNTLKKTIDLLSVERDQLRAEQDQLRAEASTLSYRGVKKIRTVLRDRVPRISFCLAALLRWAYWVWRRSREFTAEVRSISRTLINTRVAINRTWRKDCPLVSVIMPCYNYGAYLPATLDSVLAQTFQDFEIIVIDDGSTDVYTKQVLASLNTAKTRVILQTNQGLPVTRNNGIREARGKYICCLDSDDCLTPTYLEKCLYWLETKNLDLCYSWVQEFGDSHGLWVTGPFSVDSLMNLNVVSVSAVFKRSFWKKVGGYKKAMTHGYEDWEFWLTLAEHGARGHCIPEPLFLYRRHAGAMSKDMQSVSVALACIKAIHLPLYAGQASLEKLRKQQEKKYIVLYPFRNILRKCAEGAASNNGKINILFAVPWFDLGGVTVLKSEVFTRLAKKNVEVTAIATEPPEGELTQGGVPILQEYRNGNFNLTTFSENGKFPFIEYLIRSRNIHILFLAGSRFVYKSLPLLKQKFPALKIIDELFNTVGHLADNREFSRYIDMNLVANEEVRDHLIRVGETANRIKVILHGIDIDHFSAGNPEYVAYKSARSEKEFTFGFLGRFSWEKRPQDFLQLAAMLPEGKFRMRGEGSMMNSLQEEIYLKNLTGRVCFNNRFGDALEFYSGIDALIVPSEVEGLPLVLLEAMALGLPVIATKVGRIPLSICHGENGFLYDVGNMAQLCSLARMLIQMPVEQRRKIGEIARQTVVKEYSIGECSESYMRVFMSLLRRTIQ